MKNLTSVLALAAILGASALPAFATAQKNGRGHPDNGNNKNRGRGNAYGVYKNKNKGQKSDRDRDRDDRDRDERGRDERYRDDQDRDRRDRDGRRYDDRRDNDQRNNDRSLDQLSNRRQQTKNEWRNIAIASGAVAVLGLLKHDARLVFAGGAGALYSLDRYEKDRKSQSQVDRARAGYFSRDYFVREGERFNRRLVTKNGERYYQFVRAR